MQVTSSISGTIFGGTAGSSANSLRIEAVDGGAITVASAKPNETNPFTTNLNGTDHLAYHEHDQGGNATFSGEVTNAEEFAVAVGLYPRSGARKAVLATVPAASPGTFSVVITDHGDYVAYEAA